MRRVQAVGAALVVVLGVAGVACDDKTTAPGASPSTSASAVASAVPAMPSASAAASAAPTGGSADAAVDAPSAEAQAEEDEKLAMDLQTEHRHHHTGFAGLVMMAVDTLGTSTEQDAALDKIRAEFDKKVKPIHEASAALDNLLADGVAAGTIDKAKVDAAVAKASGEAANAHSAVDEELNQLHAALRPEQRLALVDKVGAEWTMWKEANALDHGGDKGEHKPAADKAGDEKHKGDGHLKYFAKKFGLTDDQVTKARAALEANKGPKTPFDPVAADAHLKAFADAFATDTFDAKKLPSGAAENGHAVAWGAERSARFYETITPILTPEQRTKVADSIREHANEAKAEGKP